MAVATANPLASQAAAKVLRGGGAAIDAGIAAQMVLAVVEPNASGLGGGALVMASTGTPFKALAFDGLAAAPARVPSRLLRDFDGRAVPADRATFGGRTVGVPGALRAFEMAHARLGRRPWAELFDAAIELAQEGFPLAPYPHRALRENPLAAEEALTRTLFRAPDGSALAPGARVRNAALGRTLRHVATHGADGFYGGELARAICDAVAADWFPGTLVPQDFADYRAVERMPVRLVLDALTVAAGPLPAFGGIAACQIAGIAARAGVASLGPMMTEDEVHILAEAGRLAFADRAMYAADPDCAPVDAAALLDPAYLADRTREIDPHGRAEDIVAGAAADPDGGSMTSHIVAADSDGAVVSITTTINQNFGARLSANGFYLNNALTNFAPNPRPGRPGAPNGMGPGKRPRTSIAPCIVFDADGRVLAAIGAGGGNRIPGTVANALLRLTGRMRDPQGIVAAPQALNWSGATEIEPALEHHGGALARRGHWVLCRCFDIGAQCLVRDGETWLAGADPRRDGVGITIR